LGNSIPLKIITVDCGIDENDDDDESFKPYGPVKKDQVVNFIREYFPNLVPQLNPEVIKNSLKVNENILKKATPGVISAAVGASLLITPVIIIPVAILFVSILAWMSSSNSKYLKIYLGHNHMFCQNQDSILKFEPVHTPNKDFSRGFIWTMEFIEEGILLYTETTNGFISIKNQKLEITNQKPMKGWEVSTKNPDSKKLMLSFKENLSLNYLCVQNDTIKLVERAQEASEFSFILADS